MTMGMCRRKGEKPYCGTCAFFRPIKSIFACGECMYFEQGKRVTTQQVIDAPQWCPLIEIQEDRANEL